MLVFDGFSPVYNRNISSTSLTVLFLLMLHFIEKLVPLLFSKSLMVMALFSRFLLILSKSRCIFFVVLGAISREESGSML